jgi:DNA-binding NtrC family response regulator
MVAPDDELVTIAEGEAGARAPADRSFTLVVTTGPDKGRRATFDGTHPSPVLVGQSESCELRLTDRQVSRRHASIEHVGFALRILDLGSTNGTFVDRVRVVEALLTGGEIVRVGATQLAVEDDPSGAPASLPEGRGFGRVIGTSREMRRLYPLFQRLAQSSVPVVLEGETGTGKEALAEALHEEGPRAKAPFVIFDCTAVPASLVEAELFGHERGAFTGAVAARRGVFEQAHRGTLFIDEIGDLEPSIQPKLLRAIERAEVRRLGGEAWIHVDARIVAATRRDLDRAVEQGRFREDLYHRLAVARVQLPPLRRRKGDVEALALRFWEQLGGDPARLSPELLSRWELYAWPGNVRELRNAVARQIAIGDLELSGVPSPSPADAASSGRDVVEELIAAGLPFPRARDRMLELFAERYVARVLAEHGGNVARAAAASGIGRRYFEKLRARSAAK